MDRNIAMKEEAKGTLEQLLGGGPPVIPVLKNPGGRRGRVRVRDDLLRGATPKKTWNEETGIRL